MACRSDDVVCCWLQEKDDKGEKVFRGPRVRMGIHWAVEGTVANRFALPALDCLL